MKPDGYVEIYSHIDAKPMIGNWEVDTFLVFAVFMLVSLLFLKGFVLRILVIALGIYLAGQYDKYKAEKVKGFALHMLYSFGIRVPEKLPPSFMRYFLGA